MPPASLVVATDEIYGRLKATLDGDPLTASVKVIYTGVRQDVPLDDADTTPPLPSPGGKPYILASIRHAGGRTASLGSVNGQKMHTMAGLLIAQVFTPTGDGDLLGRQIMDVILAGFRSGRATPSGVQFRNARPREIGVSGNWNQINFLVEFTYDQIR